VLCIKPTEQQLSVINTEAEGVFKEINFIYTTGTTIKGKSFIHRFFLNYKGFFNGLIQIKKQQAKAVILVGPISFLKELLLFMVCRILNVKLIQERSEYPFLTAKPGIIFKINLWLYLNLGLKFYNGMIIITHALMNYFKSYCRRNASFFLLPILVEPERFLNAKSPFAEPTEYIAYCGSMEGEKDGVPILIEAFAQIAPTYPTLKLVLLGDTQFDGFELLKKNIALKNLNDRIIFTGRIERDQMPQYLCNAKILALARPLSKQAEGGFPTKLGEYLATGVPVVVTKVGELPLFLTDGINAYLAEPNSIDSFASKLNEALINYNLASAIGKEGQKLAYSTFNNIYQGKLLATYIQSI
jgi:glycosyltransferase involved in cell wall biosynthesis